VLVLLTGCALHAPRPADRSEPEAISLLGEPLRRPDLAPPTRERLERDLADARTAYERAPGDAEALIWLGRRKAYLGRYRDAIEVFSEGIRLHPHDARMYRHRGHRWITVREFDRAAADLARAAEMIRGTPDEVEPDGAPNAYGIPTSTLHSNIWYHLGLAHFLQGRFEEALHAYRECMAVSDNDDMRVATADWLYMTLRRLGRDAEAAAVLEPIHRDMRILENHAYHRRLLMYRGEMPVDSLLDTRSADALQMATQGYGVGNFHLVAGDSARAEEIFRRVIGYGNWPAFGHIAAEADLARLAATGSPKPFP